MPKCKKSPSCTWRKDKLFFSLFILSSILTSNCPEAVSQSNTPVKQADTTVKIAGAMQNVMQKGELFATLDIDTISNKRHLYGLGPLENLAGEILILDGKGYQSNALHDTALQVTQTWNMKAPFFVYANIDHWEQFNLPQNIISVPLLELYLDQITKKFTRPFCFRVTATVDTALIHIVNLPPGTKVSSPEDAHQGQQDITIHDEAVELVGFFSTEHQGVFTHHDSFVHIHLITADRKKMGHLAAIKIKRGTAKLFLPVP